jgi:hypothetical protein
MDKKEEKRIVDLIKHTDINLLAKYIVKVYDDSLENQRIFHNIIETVKVERLPLYIEKFNKVSVKLQFKGRYYNPTVTLVESGLSDFLTLIKDDAKFTNYYEDIIGIIDYVCKNNPDINYGGHLNNASDEDWRINKKLMNSIGKSFPIIFRSLSKHHLEESFTDLIDIAFFNRNGTEPENFLPNLYSGYLFDTFNDVYTGEDFNIKKKLFLDRFLFKLTDKRQEEAKKYLGDIYVDVIKDTSSYEDYLLKIAEFSPSSPIVIEEMIKYCSSNRDRKEELVWLQRKRADIVKHPEYYDVQDPNKLTPLEELDDRIADVCTELNQMDKVISIYENRLKDSPYFSTFKKIKDAMGSRMTPEVSSKFSKYLSSINDFLKYCILEEKYAEFIEIYRVILKGRNGLSYSNVKIFNDYIEVLVKFNKEAVIELSLEMIKDIEKFSPDYYSSEYQVMLKILVKLEIDPNIIKDVLIRTHKRTNDKRGWDSTFGDICKVYAPELTTKN